jgi:hypothetical protein
MFASNSVNSNENLLNIIFSYLSVKDLAINSSVSKNFFKQTNLFQNYWRESCLNHFSSSCEHHR